MQSKTKLKGRNPENLSSGSGGKFPRVKEAAQMFLKKFGPLIFTVLAAVVEHHWLEQDDRNRSERETRSPDVADERDDKSSIKELRDEVAKLKRLLRRRTQGDEERRETRASARSVPRPYEMRDPGAVYERRPLYREEARRERYPRGGMFEGERLRSSPPHYPQSLDSRQRRSRFEPQALNQSGPERYAVDAPNVRENTAQPRRRHRRHSSVPNRSPYEDRISYEERVFR